MSIFILPGYNFFGDKAVVYFNKSYNLYYIIITLYSRVFTDRQHVLVNLILTMKYVPISKLLSVVFHFFFFFFFVGCQGLKNKCRYISIILLH